MKLNWAERWAVNNPLRVLQQALEIHWMRRMAGGFPQGALVLEIGCGRGAGARLLLEKFAPGLVHVTDLDLDMLRRSLRYPGPGRHKKVRLVVADAASLPYPSASFQAVFGFGVMHHVVGWRDALGEMARVLRPGGLYFLEELYPALYANFLTRRVLLHPRQERFDSISWREALKSKGFSILRALEHPMLGILAVAKLCQEGWDSSRVWS